MNILIIINDAPYGSEKAYNALRLANQIGKDQPTVSVRIFLMADAVNCAISEQKTPDGYYNIERMLKLAINKGALVKLCGSCVDARGIRTIPLIGGIEISNMEQLATWVVECDKVLIF